MASVTRSVDRGISVRPMRHHGEARACGDDDPAVPLQQPKRDSTVEILGRTTDIARNRIEYNVTDEASRPFFEERLRSLDAPAGLAAIAIEDPVMS